MSVFWQDDAKALLAAGVTISDISKKLRRSESGVRFALNINGEREKHRIRIKADRNAKRRERDRDKSPVRKTPINENGVTRSYVQIWAPKPRPPQVKVDVMALARAWLAGEFDHGDDKAEARREFGLRLRGLA